MTRDAGGPDGLGNVVLTRNLDDSVIEIAVHGPWDRQAAVDAYRAVRKGLAEHPSAIIIDLHEMSDLDGYSAPTWIAASHAAMLLQPPVMVALCAPPTRQVVTRLRQLGCTRYLSLFVTVDQARIAMANELPMTDRLQLRWLPPHSGSLSAVREVVALACGLWVLPALSEAAQKVAADLIEDSMVHARTAMLFTVCRRSTSLYLAVRDREATLPTQGDDGSEAVAARLAVVSALSYVWGASATHDGKVVWAVVR